MSKITLHQLLHHAENSQWLHPEFRFNYYNLTTNGTINSIVKECGTAGCLLGEMPLLDSDWSFSCCNLYYKSANVRYDIHIVSQYFNISLLASMHIFYPKGQSPNLFGGQNLPNTATKQEVIDNLKAFLEMFPDGDLVLLQDFPISKSPPPSVSSSVAENRNSSIETRHSKIVNQKK